MFPDPNAAPTNTYGLPQTGGAPSASGVNAMNSAVPGSTGAPGMTQQDTTIPSGPVPTGVTFGSSGANFTAGFPAGEAAVARAKAIATMQGEKAAGKPPDDATLLRAENLKVSAGELNGSLTLALANPRFAQKMGPFGAPQRALAKWDPEYQQFEALTKEIFSQYRKVITGAQASMQELKYLEGIIGGVKDTYDTFLMKNLLHASTATAHLKDMIDTQKAGFRDTTALEQSYGAMQKNLAAVQQAIGQRGLNIDNTIDASMGGASEKDRIIAKAMARGLTYEEGIEAYGKLQKQKGGSK
jgi:hypothetical protein